MGDFLVSKRSPFQNLFIFTAAGVKCRMAALKCIFILQHSADYNLCSFEIKGLIRGSEYIPLVQS